ncbi:putative dehydrogenase [Kaistia hirudinis]|uniref:Putative dehydrogenase n=1 Tax=Kaistia hirudinis TaxID=1293440 RepID=A0A840ARH1_9HYPH|nr:Gfo/Idh/MocA family oxidoreductase [Kaistia hirudinis]MBB3932252.1 putative dehydrogenase [Kaistia hirudinis]
MTKTLNVGMVGYGFMARAHSNAWSKVSNFFDTGYRPVLKAVAARNTGKAMEFADRWGYESVESDWRRLIERPDIDVIDICTPNDSHAEIAIAAAAAGKMITCEKPLARTAAEGLPMVEAVERAGVANMVWYNYRRIPAVMLIKTMIERGMLGRVYHYRAKFLQDWTISPDVPQGGPGTWRLDVDAAGSGVTGDLLAHCLDTAIWLNGSIASLTAMTETFVKERKDALTGATKKVGIDDAAAVLTRFENGSLGTFESTRYARGHKAAYTLEINGEKGSFAWDLHDLNRLSWFDHRTPGELRGWSSILVTDGDHPYLGKWWVPGLIIGYEHSFVHQVADFLEGLATGKPAAPTFRDALETAKVCDAIIASGETGQWVELG